MQTNFILPPHSLVQSVKGSVRYHHPEQLDKQIKTGDLGVGADLIGPCWHLPDTLRAKLWLVVKERLPYLLPKICIYSLNNVSSLALSSK